MARHVVKVSRSGGQFRITVPKCLVRQLRWQSADYVEFRRLCGYRLELRRLRNGKKVESGLQDYKAGADR